MHHFWYFCMKTRTAATQSIADDWHPADVKAALEKAGWSLRRLSVHHGFKPESLAKALRHPWPRAESLIAAAIHESPERVWPSRYAEDGESHRRLARQEQPTSR